MRLAVPKDSRLRHAASHGLSHSPLPLHPITCVVLPGAGSDHRNFRVAAARLIARLDEQDSKIQKVRGPA